MIFKKMIFGAMVAVFPVVSNAKTLRDSVVVDANLTTYSIHFDKVVPVIADFIENNSLQVKSKTQDYESIHYDLVMSETQYSDIKQHLAEWKCDVINATETTSDLSRKLENQAVSIERLKSDIREIEKKMDKTNNDSILADLEDQLYELNDILKYKNRDYMDDVSSIGTVNLSLYLMRDETTPRQTKVRFVNMPGFEYSFLMVGNPKPGFSAEYYNGYNLKYLFTKGKTFINVGIYKAQNVASTDTTTLTDAFNISFGQDFYSRHFGRGARKCFNMYSGYNIGFMAFRGETTSAKTFYVTPTVGVELLKNRFVLWDLRGSYYLPFKYNYDLRGWQFSSSFNVAF